MTERASGMPSDWIVPDWPASPRVRAFITSRNGGVSGGPYSGQGGGMNLGRSTGDDGAAIDANRQLLRSFLPGEPYWVHQVHGKVVVEAGGASLPQADGSFTRQPGQVCVVQAADCMPVLFCDRAGSVVAAAHAGWRGLVAGVLEAALAAMGVPGTDVLAFLGPAIGPERFEVGDDVREAFVQADADAAAAFKAHAPGKWMADLEWLARRRLALAGVAAVYGGGQCTVTQEERYYSFRRDRVTGRMAGLIWLEPDQSGC